MYIAHHGFRTPANWFRKLHAFPGVWEVRRWGNFRLYGFMLGERQLHFCCHEYKKRNDPDKATMRRVMDLRRELAELLAGSE